MRSFPLFLTAAVLGLARASESEQDVTVTATATLTHTVCPVTSILTCNAPDATAVSPGKGNNGAEDVWASLWDKEKTKYGIWDDWNTATETSSAITSETETSSAVTSGTETSSAVTGGTETSSAVTSGTETSSATASEIKSATTDNGSGSSTSYGSHSDYTTTSFDDSGKKTSISWISATTVPSNSTTYRYVHPTSYSNSRPLSKSTSPGYVKPTLRFSSSSEAGKPSSTSSVNVGQSTTASTTAATFASSTTTRASTTTSSSTCPAYTPPANSTDDDCNSAADRSQWCDKKDLKTDYYTDDYSTGVTRTYTFEITNTTLVFDGTGPKLALAINGQVPGPVIEANWGDMVEVTVINKMPDNSTSIHFHGVRQYGTNDQDGVPGITECAIAGNGGSRTYTWKASAYGTSWYHSHAFAQYGDGIRGPIVIHGPATANYDYDMGTVMIDDTFPVSVAAMASRIAHIGPGGSFNTLFNGKNKNPDGTAPGGTPFSWGVKPCRKHLFRIINSSAQNSYIVGFDKHTMTVIAADFVPIKPYKTTTLNIANGQRYDVIVEMDQVPSSYYVRAVIQTQCPSGGANSGLGTANAIINYEGATPVSPISSTTITNVTANICQDEPLASLVPYLEKPAGSLTSFQASASTVPAGSVTSLSTNDDGTVFQWYLNNAAINVNYSQPTLKSLASGDTDLISSPILLNQANQWVYFIIQNQFFASHPMHVHGHDVSILGTGTGTFTSDLVSSLKFDNPMRRDTVMLRGSPGVGYPAGYTVIGFETDNPGAWLMHCHITWHADGGLALQFIERPDDIPSTTYVGQSFNDECSALATYETSYPQGKKLSGQSGLKRSSEGLDISKWTAGAKMSSNKYRKRFTGRHTHTH